MEDIKPLLYEPQGPGTPVTLPPSSHPLPYTSGEEPGFQEEVAGPPNVSPQRGLLKVRLAPGVEGRTRPEQPLWCYLSSF